MREIERLKRGKSSVDIRKAAAVSAQTHGTSQGPPPGDTSPGRRGKRLLTVDSRSPPPPKNSGACTREDGRFRFSEEISPQQRQRQESQQVAAHASPAAAVEADRASPSSKRAVHWSQVKPISENEVSGSGSVPVNLADGQFDEAKQKEDFQAAVMAWRNGGARGPTSSASSSYSSSTGAGGSLLSGSGGMWNNPLGDQGGAASEGKTSAAPNLSVGMLDEAAERQKFQDAVAEWRNGGTSKQPHTSDVAAGGNSMKPHTRTSFAATMDGRETSAFDGTPDEAAEHERFRRAVEDWREGKTTDGALSPGRKSAAVASSLLKKMANDDLLRRQKFEQEKRALEEGLQRDRADLRRRREEAAAKLAASKFADDDCADAGGKVSSRVDEGRARKYDTKKLWDMEIEY
jgi:hypothetical protein